MRSSFIFFISTALIVYIGLHGFVYWRIVHGLEWLPSQRNWLKLFLFVMGISFVVAELVDRFIRAVPLLFIGSTWLGIVAMAFFVFILEWGLSAIFPGNQKTLTRAALILLLLVVLFSFYNGLRKPVIKEIKVPLLNWPGQLSGFTIVHLSDLHLGNLVSIKRLQWIVDRVNSLNPDLIAITGDLIDRDICDEKNFCQILGTLRSRFGVFAVTGNHEFYAGIDKFNGISRQLGIRVLRNEMTTVADAIEIAGLDDDAGEQFSAPGPDPEKALKNHDPSKPLILLYHRPTGFAKAMRMGVALQLSGHTHAGQIPPADLLVLLAYRYPFGFYKRADSYIYTTCGTGTWGPPLRLFSRSEIVKLVLVKK